MPTSATGHNRRRASFFPKSSSSSASSPSAPRWSELISYKYYGSVDRFQCQTPLFAEVFGVALFLFPVYLFSHSFSVLNIISFLYQTALFAEVTRVALFLWQVRRPKSRLQPTNVFPWPGCPTIKFLQIWCRKNVKNTNFPPRSTGQCHKTIWHAKMLKKERIRKIRERRWLWLPFLYLSIEEEVKRRKKDAVARLSGKSVLRRDQLGKDQSWTLSVYIWIMIILEIYLLLRYI